MPWNINVTESTEEGCLHVTIETYAEDGGEVEVCEIGINNGGVGQLMDLYSLILRKGATANQIRQSVMDIMAMQAAVEVV